MQTVNKYIDALAPMQTGVAVTPGTAFKSPLARDGYNPPTNAVYVGGSGAGSTGNLAVTMADGSALTFNNVAAGTTLNIAITAVASSGTTATNILALW